MQEIQNYVEEVLGLKASAPKFIDLQVPFFIKDTYELLHMQLRLSEKHTYDLVLIIQKEDEYPGIVSLSKHLKQIHKITREPLVYVNNALSAADRKSLINNNVNFIKPYSQLFIPELALDLRENYRQKRSSIEVENLFPATQAVMIACFNRGWSTKEVYTSSQLVQGLVYSRVTISKVIDQLINIGVLFRGDKARTYFFNEPEKLVFEKITPLLKSPIKREVFINARLDIGKGIFFSGETALAQYSMLAEPAKPIYGLTQEDFATLVREGEVWETESIDEIKATVELWTYPNPIVGAEVADPISLFVSLRDHNDERIQIALDEMMGEIPWLK